jgi:PhnB protein
MAEHTPDSHKDRIMHSSLRIGERLIMGADAPPQWFSKPQGFSVSINDPDTARMGAVFATLAEGGTVMMPFAPTFWSEGFGMCIDKYGTPWIVNGAEKPMA